jgi:hypothetical protein
MWNILRRKEHQDFEPRALAEDTFQKLLCLESKRSNRSQRRFALMLLETESQDPSNEVVMSKLLSVLPASTRETDIAGWYRNGSVIGVIFTDIGTVDDRTVRNVLLMKIDKVLRDTLNAQQANQIQLSFQIFSHHSEVIDDTLAARYRDIVRNSHHESTEMFALRATNASS